MVKNKVAPPFQVAEFDIMYNEGISVSSDLIDLGLQYEVLVKSGNTVSLGETKLGVGREQARQFLKDNLKVAKEIREAVWQKVKEQRAAEK